MDNPDDCAKNLIIANNEILIQNEENEKLIAELAIADKELHIQEKENEKLTAELIVADNVVLVQHEGIRLTEEQIKFDKQNLDALINNIHDLMWSVDTEYNLITSNRPFDEMVTLLSGNPIKRGSTILVDSFSKEQLIKYKGLYERAFTGEIFTEIEHGSNPEEFWSEISYYPIKNGNEIIGTACHSRDITVRKNAELERLEIINDLIQRNRDLEEFAHMVSHKLRAPVASILGATNVFNDPELSSEEKISLVEAINECAIKLDKVVNNLNEILQVNVLVKK